MHKCMMKATDDMAAADAIHERIVAMIPPLSPLPDGAVRDTVGGIYRDIWEITTPEILAAFAHLGFPTSDSMLKEVERRSAEWGRDDKNAPHDQFWILLSLITPTMENPVMFDCEETVRIR